jgi:hypothetical protein
MTFGTAWGLLANPLTNIGLGLLLAVGALALLREYRELFMRDPRAVMSVEVLMAIISRGGGPGYFAAFLLAGALISLVWGLYVLITRLPYVIG